MAAAETTVAEPEGCRPAEAACMLAAGQRCYCTIAEEACMIVAVAGQAYDSAAVAGQVYKSAAAGLGECFELGCAQVACKTLAEVVSGSSCWATAPRRLLALPACQASAYQPAKDPHRADHDSRIPLDSYPDSDIPEIARNGR